MNTYSVNKPLLLLLLFIIIVVVIFIVIVIIIIVMILMTSRNNKNHPHVYSSLSFTWERGLNQGTRSSGKFEDIRIYFHRFDDKE